MKRKVALFVVVAAIVVAVVLALFLSPKATVVAAEIPGTTLESGDSAIIYRIAVTAEWADVKIEQVYLTFSPGASLSGLCWYDEDNGTQLSGASYYSYWSGWLTEAKITIPEGTTKIFSLQGNVAGQGTVSIRMQDMVIEKGSVEGLPAAIVTLTVN